MAQAIKRQISPADAQSAHARCHETPSQRSAQINGTKGSKRGSQRGRSVPWPIFRFGSTLGGGRGLGESSVAAQGPLPLTTGADCAIGSGLEGVAQTEATWRSTPVVHSGGGVNQGQLDCVTEWGIRHNMWCPGSELDATWPCRHGAMGGGPTVGCRSLGAGSKSQTTTGSGRQSWRWHSADKRLNAVLPPYPGANPGGSAASAGGHRPPPGSPTARRSTHRRHSQPSECNGGRKRGASLRGDGPQLRRRRHDVADLEALGRRLALRLALPGRQLLGSLRLGGQGLLRRRGRRLLRELREEGAHLGGRGGKRHDAEPATPSSELMFRSHNTS